MHKKLILAAVVALLLAVGGVPLAVAGGDRNGDKNGDHVRILHVTLTDTDETDFDLGASGPSVGDRFIVFGTVSMNGKRVGAGGYECTTMLFTPGPDPAGEPEAFTDQCVATLSLRKGQITVQGLVDRTGPVPVALAITGGTGAYRTAHGQLETSGPNEAGDEPLTLKLVLDDD
jgi:allene oxide cyclase-like protein